MKQAQEGKNLALKNTKNLINIFLTLKKTYLGEIFDNTFKKNIKIKKMF